MKKKEWGVRTHLLYVLVDDNISSSGPTCPRPPERQSWSALHEEGEGRNGAF